MWHDGAEQKHISGTQSGSFFSVDFNVQKRILPGSCKSGVSNWFQKGEGNEMGLDLKSQFK